MSPQFRKGTGFSITWISCCSEFSACCGRFECVTCDTSYFQLRLGPNFVSGVICVAFGSCLFSFKTSFCISGNFMGLIIDVYCIFDKILSGYTHNAIFRILYEMKTSQQHAHPTFYIKIEPTTRNIQNSYSQQQRKTNTPTKYTSDPQHVNTTKYSRHDF
jgi:hypothetical protein